MALGVDNVLAVEVLQQDQRFRRSCTLLNAAISPWKKISATSWPGMHPLEPLSKACAMSADSEGMAMPLFAKLQNMRSLARTTIQEAAYNDLMAPELERAWHGNVCIGSIPSFWDDLRLRGRPMLEGYIMGSLAEGFHRPGKRFVSLQQSDHSGQIQLTKDKLAFTFCRIISQAGSVTIISFPFPLSNARLKAQRPFQARSA